MKGRLVFAAVLMLCAATASAQSLQCAVSPQPAVLGQPLAWTVTVRDLKQPLPAFTPAQFAPDWLLQGQQGESGSDGAGHSTQSSALTLYPLRAGVLALPAVQVGSRACVAQTVRVADAAPGEAPLQWRTRIDPAQPARLQAVRVELQVAGGGNLVWDTPPARSAQAVLTPLPSDTRSETVDGQRQLVQVFAWKLLPLQSGPVTVDFGLVRAHAFGQLRVYAPPPLRLTVAALPLWWPADGLVGKPQVQTLQASRALQLGQTGVWRLRIAAAGLDRAQVLRAMQAWQAQVGDGLRIVDVQLRRSAEGGAPSAGDAAWDISVFFQPTRGGRLAPPALRLEYFDPRSALPAVEWHALPPVAVRDPRPLRVLLAVGGVLALVGALAALRWAVCCLRGRARLHRALLRLAEADGADALRRGWLALPPGAQPQPAPTLAAWLHAAAVQDDAALRAAATALQTRLYAAPPAAQAADAPAASRLAHRLRRRFTACGIWR
ncbi:MAG: hypothetical protein ACP5RV_03335 [Thiomonas sp.]